MTLGKRAALEALVVQEKRFGENWRALVLVSLDVWSVRRGEENLWQVTTKNVRIKLR